MSLSDYQCFSSQKLASPGGMNWRGTWNILNVYQYGDVIEAPDGEGYVCIDLDGNIGSTPGTAPAVWQLLSSGTATAVTLGSAIGSGITTAEPTPNNFTVATNLVAGSGIGLTPSLVNTSLTVDNTGVLSVSAGTGISVGGTAQNPSVANSGVLSVAAGTGISLGGTAQNPSVANAGVLSVSAGTGISVGGTAQNPSIAQSNGYAYVTTVGATQMLNNLNGVNVITNFSTLIGSTGFTLPSPTTIAIPAIGTYRVIVRICVTGIATASNMVFYLRYNGTAVLSSATYTTLPAGLTLITPVVIDSVFAATVAANLEVIATPTNGAGQSLVNQVAVTNPPSAYTAPAGPAVVVEIFRLA